MTNFINDKYPVKSDSQGNSLDLKSKCLNKEIIFENLKFLKCDILEIWHNLDVSNFLHNHIYIFVRQLEIKNFNNLYT